MYHDFSRPLTKDESITPSNLISNLPKFIKINLIPQNPSKLISNLNMPTQASVFTAADRNTLVFL